MRDDVSRANLDVESVDRFVRLRSPLGVTSFGINKIVLAPGQRGRIHRHRNQEEVYLVLEGTLTLLVEGEPAELGPAELIRVGPDVRRQLVNRGPGRLSLLALGGMVEHEHVPRDGEAFVAWEDAIPRSPQEVPLPDDLPAGERR
jgi:mannose-6-phosphate isomerase-like protein (cupin superfamily)